MVKSLLIAVNKKLACDDLGKLLLRLAVGGLMLFHGLHKLFGGVGSSAACWWKKGCRGLSPTAC
jgi:putative oxidoreductase